MRPFVALSFLMACASAAPQHLAGHGLAYAGAAGHGLAYAGAAGLAHGAVTQSVGPAPLATHPLQAGPVVPHPVNYVAPAAPAPFTTSAQAAGVTTVHQPASVVTKQVHLGQTSFVSGYATRILKPATPHLPISVPTVLRGSVAYNAPIVKEQVEIHNVQNPVVVERRVEVPYDVPVYKDNIISVPTPVHVDAPYNVAVPTPVRGHDIVQYRQTAPIVQRTHSHVHTAAQPVAAVGYAHAAPAALGYAAQPVAALGHAAIGHAAIAPAAVAAIH